MGPKTCKKCGSELVAEASACPKCGATAGLSKQARVALVLGGCCALVILILLAFLVVVVIFSAATGGAPGGKSAHTSESAERDGGLHETGEEFRVGYMTYRLSGSWWSASLSSSPFL